MSLFGMLNKMSGYTEENMIKCFDQLLTPIASQSLCSIGVSLKAKKTLFSSKAIASGFAAITNTNILVLYTIIPMKSAALYDFHSPKKLTIKKGMANQIIIEGKLFNIHTQEFDDVILQTAPHIDGFQNQATNLEYFITILEPHKTE